MPTYSISAPDGKTYQIEGPAGATDDQVRAEVLRQNPGLAAPKPAAPTKAAAPAPKRSVADDVAGYFANANRGVGYGDELSAGLHTIGDVVTGKSGPNIYQTYKDELGRQRQMEDSFSSAHPVAAANGRALGMTGTAVIPAGATANMFATGGRLANAARGATVAALQAGGYAAADRGTFTDRAQAAADAMNPFKSPLTYAVGAGLGGMSGTAKPKPKISQDVVDLRAKGVQLTPGQARGGISKAAEDAMTSTPILGTAIQDARHAGLESYNTGAANDALSHIGQTVPQGLPAGHATVAHVEQQLGKAYDATIPTANVALDGEFKQGLATRLGEVAQDMTPAGRKRLGQILDQRVTSRLGSAQEMDGKTFQSINSQLSTTKGRFSSSQDADQRAIAEGIGIMQEELRSAAARQDPEFAAAKDAIDMGYAKFKRMQGAAAAAGAEGGVFTPSQYGGAVRRADKSVDKGATARGDAYGQDYADAGRAVLPNKTPDSGTATRGAYLAAASAPGAIIGAWAGGGPVAGLGVAAGYGATLGGLKLAAKAYAPEAIAAYNKVLDGKITRQQQSIALKELSKLAGNDNRLAPLLTDARERLARTAVLGSRNIYEQPANP